MSEALPASAADDFPRRVTPEILDELPASDPRAQRSRGDLRRINRITAAVTWLERGLTMAAAEKRPRTVVELGAGDGTLALRLARSLGNPWLGTHLTLLDLEPSVAQQTADAIRACGWTLEVVAADALDWLERARPERVGVVLANLFVHHFEGERLARLLGGIGANADAFVCCEPRRSRVALAGSRLLGLIGCNDVTRHDAVVSVRAGFRDDEIGVAWRDAVAGPWTLKETRAGAFSHLFVARRDD
ncbi:MAG TPA: methyltransferase domain-containing protein [Gammaproteobacteria bacterium]|nr:methyltransferase domain-containing protein [Gammaproteobacteria bacterium]